ncbi:hypothetical protein WJX79_000204 [Trebouxia sp. C0005]
MVAKQQEVVDRLRSLDRSTRLKANCFKRTRTLSFSSQDNTVVEAALRALKLIWQSSGATAPHQLDGLNLERLVSLLSASNSRTSEIATQVLAQYCQCADMEVLARLAQDPNDKVGATTVETVHRAMLPVLLKLLHTPAVLDTAPQVLTDLLQQSPAMQKAANDSDAVSSLTTLLHHEQTWLNRPCFKEGVLRALAILCKNHGDARMNFMERASIGQHSALKALSNLVLDTASAKDSVAQSAVMAALSWNQILPLLQDTNSCVQDKSFMFMRNLAAGRSAAECVKQWSRGSAVPALVARMQNLPPPQHILVHILYCLSNFASTGSEEDRDAIASVAGECIKAHLHHEGVEVRTAALWVILNLTDGADDDAPDRAMKRIQQFQSLGTEERLRDMLQDMSLDVQERVSTALNNFGCTSSDTSEF